MRDVKINEFIDIEDMCGNELCEDGCFVRVTLCVGSSPADRFTQVITDNSISVEIKSGIRYWPRVFYMVIHRYNVRNIGGNL